MVRPSQGFGFGEQGKKGIYFSGADEQIFRGTGEQRQYWGTGNIRKQIFVFWRTEGKNILFQGHNGTGTPPPPREGLSGG